MPGIHVLLPWRDKDLDGRDEPGHDAEETTYGSLHRFPFHATTRSYAANGFVCLRKRRLGQTKINMNCRLTCRFGAVSFVVSWFAVRRRHFLDRRSRGIHAWYRREGRRSDMNFSYRWVIVAVGALMTCVGIGAMFSLAVYLEPMSASTGWSRAGISSAMTLDFLVMGVASFGWGAASDRFGTRIVVLTGAVLLGLGLLLASRATSLIEFQLTYGILVGLAAGSFFAPMIAATTTWFVSNRSLAVSLVSAGMGVAPMTISPFARWLISTYDWRVAMMTIGIAAWVLLVPAALLVRRPAQATNDGAANAAAEPSEMSAAQALHSPRFLVLALTFFLCCAAHSGPIFHMVSYAMLCGVPAMAAVSIYSGGPGRAWRPSSAGRARRPARRQASTRRRPSSAGAGDRDLSLC